MRSEQKQSTAKPAQPSVRPAHRVKNLSSISSASVLHTASGCRTEAQRLLPMSSRTPMRVKHEISEMSICSYYDFAWQN
jgi:hypothetical protein